MGKMREYIEQWSFMGNWEAGTKKTDTRFWCLLLGVSSTVHNPLFLWAMEMRKNQPTSKPKTCLVRLLQQGSPPPKTRQTVYQVTLRDSFQVTIIRVKGTHGIKQTDRQTRMIVVGNT